MPVVLGLASSHAPSMFCPADAWPQVHKGLSRDVPQPKKLAEETPEVLQSYVERVQRGFGELRSRLEAEWDAWPSMRHAPPRCRYCTLAWSLTVVDS